MKIKWNRTFEIEVIDEFNEKTGDVEKCRNAIVKSGDIVEVESIQSIKDSDTYVDIKLEDGSNIMCINKNTFDVITEGLSLDEAKDLILKPFSQDDN